MSRALELAATPGVPLGPNPRVGCVILADDGRTVAEGHHRGAGTAHAEADALAQAGDDARGTTAVVTLEPCNHTGRTGPVQRGAGRGRRTPRGLRPGGPQPGRGRAERRGSARPASRSSRGSAREDARALNRVWTFAVEHGRPFVTWKFATTLDGRSAAADGTSRWVSGLASRRDTHRLRALCDVMLVGTNTVAVDDPRLTVRDDDDQETPGPAAARGDGGARPRPRRAGCSTTPPRRSTCAPATRTRRWPSCSRGTGSTCSSRAARRWPPRSWARAWSTRSSPTSRRCCWAPARRRSATWESPRWPTRCDWRSPT